VSPCQRDLSSRKKSLPPLPLERLNSKSSKTIDNDYGYSPQQALKRPCEKTNEKEDGFDFSFSHLNQGKGQDEEELPPLQTSAFKLSSSKLKNIKKYKKMTSLHGNGPLNSVKK